MFDEVRKTLILETVRIKGNKSSSGVLNLDVPVYKVDRIFTTFYYFFDLFLLADLGHN